MSKAFTEISAGLEDAKAHAQGLKSKVVEHKPERLNVKATHEKSRFSYRGLSPHKFT